MLSNVKINETRSNTLEHVSFPSNIYGHLLSKNKAKTAIHFGASFERIYFVDIRKIFHDLNFCGFIFSQCENNEYVLFSIIIIF